MEPIWDLLFSNLYTRELIRMLTGKGASGRHCNLDVSGTLRFPYVMKRKEQYFLEKEKMHDWQDKTKIKHET